jgi:hypothetical protein
MTLTISSHNSPQSSLLPSPTAVLGGLDPCCWSFSSITLNREPNFFFISFTWPSAIPNPASIAPYQLTEAPLSLRRYATAEATAFSVPKSVSLSTLLPLFENKLCHCYIAILLSARIGLGAAGNGWMNFFVKIIKNNETSAKLSASAGRSHRQRGKTPVRVTQLLQLWHVARHRAVTADALRLQDQISFGGWRFL